MRRPVVPALQCMLVPARHRRCLCPDLSPGPMLHEPHVESLSNSTEGCAAYERHRGHALCALAHRHLHIGGARTALFNWLYARHTAARSCCASRTPTASAPRPKRRRRDPRRAALDGLNWDGEPSISSPAPTRHREVAEQLLAQGKAYRCYATRGRTRRDARTAQRGGPAACAMTAAGATAIASDAPAGGTPCHPAQGAAGRRDDLHDRVLGDVRFANDQLDDMVLLRSDGTPTYMLAVVVDDHDMGVTHVIRGADHLNNAAPPAADHRGDGLADAGLSPICR